MVGIYKFTNKINGNSYIGQSVNIRRRYNNHKTNCKCKRDDMYFTRALREFGFWNFEFEVLEECSREELNQKEQYYINKYNTIYPNGYNKELGGNPGHIVGLSSAEDVESITRLLLDTDMSAMEIAEMFNVSDQTVYDINSGKTWVRDGILYPIRQRRYCPDGVPPRTLNSKKEYFCESCGSRLYERTKTGLCKTCYDEISSAHIPSKETLYSLLQQHSFVYVGKMYGVSDNAVRKWCLKYNIPKHSSYYRKLAAS